MNEQLISFTLIILFSLFALYMGIFIITKQAVLKTEKFPVFRDFTPLPKVFNYLLFKWFIIISALITLYIGIDGILRNI